ncbi:MAG: DUF4230 domain-containing protein [Planctomycetes bacterium]|nr:DUF4230 domain-containing protein [Planctomycetota bacterium]
MKELMLMVVLGIAIALGLILGERLLGWPRLQPVMLNLQQIQALAELVTLKIEIVDIQESKVQGYLGSRQVVVVVRGEIMIATDLSQARLEQLDGQAKTAVLVFMPPRMISARLDHGRTKIIASDAGGLWRIAPGDAGRTAAADRAYGEAQKMLAKAGEDRKLMDQAKQRAETVLKNFCQGLGVSVEIKWDG